MAVDKSKNTQILLTIPNDMVEEIENYWHDNRLNSRSEAIRNLIAIALEKTAEK